MKIAMVTDTDASLSAGLAARYGIHQVLIAFLFGPEQVIMAELSTGPSVHTAAGMVGVAFVAGRG